MTEPRTRKGNLESWISAKPNDRGYYEAKVWMGTKGDGSPDRRHVQRRTLKDVRARVRELEAQRDAGRATRAGKAPTVQEVLERHLTVILPGRGRAPRTIADYRSKCRNDIYPRWGGQRADRLRPDQVEDGLAEMLAAGHAASHVRKVHAILSSAFEDLVKSGTVKRNPLEHIQAPPADEPDITALTQAQAQNIAVTALTRPNGVRWSVGLATGLRQGEALGLRWSFIDLDTGWMRIWHQLQRLSWEHGCGDPHACGAKHHRLPCPVPCPRAKRAQGRRHVCVQNGGTPRSASGTKGKLCAPGCTAHARYCPRRKLPRGCAEVSGGLVLRPIKEKRRKRVKLPRELLPALKAHRDAQYLQRLAAAGEWEENDLVFAQWNGRPVDPRRDWSEWQFILEAAGMSRQRLHIMRHTAATIMLERGVAIAVVMQALGHSDIRITSRYSHASEGLLEDAADRVGDLYAFDNETVNWNQKWSR